jgi:hypothetical protein
MEFLLPAKSCLDYTHDNSVGEVLAEARRSKIDFSWNTNIHQQRQERNIRSLQSVYKMNAQWEISLSNHILVCQTISRIFVKSVTHGISVSISAHTLILFLNDANVFLILVTESSFR